MGPNMYDAQHAWTARAQVPKGKRLDGSASGSASSHSTSAMPCNREAAVSGPRAGWSPVAGFQGDLQRLPDGLWSRSCPNIRSCVFRGTVAVEHSLATTK